MNNNLVQILFLKVEQSSVQMVNEILIQYPHLIDIEHPKTGQTCLTVATRKNDGAMIEKLVSLNADINKSNKFNQTPLWISAFNNFKRTADFLLSKGANANLADKKGFTPLMVAAQRGNLEVIGLLLNANADVQQLNKNHDSVFDLCKDYETLQFIIQTLQIDEVKVKQPEKFKPKTCNSQKSTQSKFSTSQTPYKHQKSESTPNISSTLTYPLHDLVASLCEELQMIFAEQLRIFKDFILNEFGQITDIQRRIQQYFLQLKQNSQELSGVQFQYDNFQFEISQQIGRTVYSILHQIQKEQQQQQEYSSQPQPQSFKSEFHNTPTKCKYKSNEPLMEATVEEEQSTPLSEFRQILKKVDVTSQLNDPFRRNNHLQQEMTQKLESLNLLINQKIQNIKLQQ